MNHVRAARRLVPAALLLVSIATAVPSAAGDARPPVQSRTYAPCLDGRPVRLKTRGFTIEPLSAEATEAGVLYVLGAGADGGTERSGLVPWRELRGPDVWSPSASTRQAAFERGALLGALVGVGVMFLVTDPPVGVSAPLYGLEVALGALPFALAGGFVAAARHSGDAGAKGPRGHWVHCRSGLAPYGWHASVPPDDATPPAAAEPAAGSE